MCKKETKKKEEIEQMKSFLVLFYFIEFVSHVVSCLNVGVVIDVVIAVAVALAVIFVYFSLAFPR